MKDRASITVRTRSIANMQKAKALAMNSPKQSTGRGR